VRRPNCYKRFESVLAGRDDQGKLTTTWRTDHTHHSEVWEYQAKEHQTSQLEEKEITMQMSE